MTKKSNWHITEEFQKKIEIAAKEIQEDIEKQKKEDIEKQKKVDTGTYTYNALPEIEEVKPPYGLEVKQTYGLFAKEEIVKYLVDRFSMIDPFQQLEFEKYIESIHEESYKQLCAVAATLVVTYKLDGTFKEDDIKTRDSIIEQFSAIMKALIK